MLKLLVCEFWKLKRKKLFYISFLTTFIMPIAYAAILSERSLDNMASVVREENGFLLLLPLSVVLAANLFFGEHDDDTLKNLLCIPVAGGRLVMAKMAVLLLFDVGYLLASYIAGFLLVLFSGGVPAGWQKELVLTLGTGILLWAASMPCILLVVWANRSYIISVIIAFAYTVLSYILQISDSVMMIPLGCNVQTFLPIPLMKRWLYQYHQMEGASGEALAFYQRFCPYFVTTPVIFGILGAEAVICMALIIHVWRRKSV